MAYRSALLLASLSSAAWISLFLVCATQAAENQAAETTIAIVASPESLAEWKYEFTPADEQLLDEIQRGCFNYFWQEVGEPACLARDKSSDTVCSTAAVGFQLASLPIGVERGWITRDEGRQRALVVLRALTERTDNKKFGIYLHFLDENSGGLPDYSRTKYEYELQASTIDHALLQAGAMTVAEYFGGEVATAAAAIVDNANWRAMFDEPSGTMTMGWRASTTRGPDGPGALSKAYWHLCSDEERLVDFLAVGAASAHAIEPAAYYHLGRNVKQQGDMPPYVVSWNGSLFTYFFSHCWIDYRHLAADNPQEFGEEGPAVDWFENSRRAALTHRARCIEVSKEYPTLGENRWGMAPCTYREHYFVHEVRPNLSDRDEWYEGVLPPYAAASAIMFTPAESLAALREYRSLKDDNGQLLAWHDPAQGGFGFVDSFTLDPLYGHSDNLGIDQGPMLLAIENVRTGLIWKLFMQHPAAKRAVERLQLKPR